MNETGIRWTSIKQYFDIDTGEQIETRKLKEYIIIKTIKYAEINHIKTRGITYYTKLCRRNPQRELKFE